jgi:hypothetical protein
MKPAAFAVTLLLLAAAPSRLSAQEPAPDQTLERMKAVLQKKPLRLDVPEVEPTFKIEIKAIHPLHEIFEKPPWQLPPILWHVPAMGPSTAFGTIPIFSVDLLPLAKSAKHALDERRAREEVEREIAGYCAGQPNPQSIAICSPGRIIR